MTDEHGQERRQPGRQNLDNAIAIARVEEAVKSLGRSIDGLGSTLTDHIIEEKALAQKVDEIEKDFDELRGGAKLFFKMAAIMVIVSGGIWSAATWVASKS